MSVSLDIEHCYQRYGPMVLRRCRHLLGHEADALDAMQDVFVQLVRHQQQLDNRSPSALLHRIATHQCLNRLRTRQRRPETQDDALLATIIAHSDLEERSIAGRILDQIFQREPISTATIAVLHYLDGMTLEEVAAEVGLSVSGVRKRLRMLRAKIEEST